MIAGVPIMECLFGNLGQQFWVILGCLLVLRLALTLAKSMTWRSLLIEAPIVAVLLIACHSLDVLFALYGASPPKDPLRNVMLVLCVWRLFIFFLLYGVSQRTSRRLSRLGAAWRAIVTRADQGSDVPDNSARSAQNDAAHKA